MSREMELLVFGHAGVPHIIFPTSCGRFFDFEDRGMVAALSDKIDRGELQLYCVDSVDSESWYNRTASPRTKIVRHMQYESYVLEEVLPLVRQKNSNPYLKAMGCSFGGYHAVNVALRHPDRFSGFLSISGIFDLSRFLRGHYDNDCHLNIPMHYLADRDGLWHWKHLDGNSYVLVTGELDHCRNENERLATLLQAAGVPHRLEVWDGTSHDWPWWRQMVKANL